MKKSVLVVSVLAIAMSVVVSGCGTSGTAKPGGTSAGAGAAKAPYNLEKPYPTITPQSPDEMQAAASTGKSLATYIKNTQLANEQNKRSDPIFDNKQGYKPRFVGYGFVIITGTPVNGAWKTLDVSAFDGGKQIKPMSAWERFGSANKGDGVMNDSYYEGASTTFDPSQYTKAITPVSAQEKAAQAAVEAWAKKNLDPSFDRVALTTYLFLWGEVDQDPNMMMSIAPDGFSYNSVISWGVVK